MYLATAVPLTQDGDASVRSPYSMSTASSGRTIVVDSPCMKISPLRIAKLKSTSPRNVSIRVAGSPVDPVTVARANKRLSAAIEHGRLPFDDQLASNDTRKVSLANRLRNSLGLGRSPEERGSGPFDGNFI